MEELAGVRREALLVLQQGVDAAALLRRPAAVEAEDDLVPDVDGREARRLAKISRRWSSSSGAERRARALAAAARVPSSSSLLISLRVSSTAEPSP